MSVTTKPTLTPGTFVPRVGPYTFETRISQRRKDPINLAFVDMMGGMDRVQDILGSLHFTFPWGVGDQFFAEPDNSAPYRRPQDLNLATSVTGWRGRDHVRLFSLNKETGQPHVIVGAVHRERWPEYLWWIRKPCDAVESFDAPRRSIELELGSHFRVSTRGLGNCNPFPQCSGDLTASDGCLLVIEEPGP